MQNLDSERRFIVAAAITLGALQWAGLFMIDAQASYFCRPAATLASIFLGGACALSPAGWTVTYRGIDAVVGISCSGFTFFSILYSLMVGLVFRHLHVKRAALHAALLLPAAYAVALAVNGARVAASFYALLAASHLPEQIAGKLHLSVGVTIFLTSLIASYLIAERKYRNVHP